MQSSEPGTFVVAALAVLSALALVMTWLADRAVALTLRARPAADPAALPPISIFKPVKGVDDGLRENLASLAQQIYPAEFEILVGAAEASDPALAVARAVAADHPGTRMRVLVCPEDGGLNPKVSILRALSGCARHEQLLVSDSNVRVGTDYLAVTARALIDPRVGLVTNPIVGVGERSLGALLENLHLCTFVARAVSFTKIYAGRACVIGKSMLFRRSDLTLVGGWARVRDVLAEDYVLGHAFEQAGLGVAVAPYLIRTYNRDWSLARFVNRHLRWGQMRRRICLSAFLAEPLSNPPALLVALALASASWSPTPAPWIAAAAAGLSGRLLLDRRLIRRMTGRTPAAGTLLLGLLKDLAMMILWAVAAFRRTVDWRGRIMLIGPGTRLERPSELSLPMRKPA